MLTEVKLKPSLIAIYHNTSQGLHIVLEAKIIFIVRFFTFDHNINFRP